MLHIFLEWSQFKFVFDTDSMEDLALITIDSVECCGCVILLTSNIIWQLHWRLIAIFRNALISDCIFDST